MTDSLRAGDWVEVKSAEQILATLDADGRRDALPFMPEMLQYCGKRFRVFKSAHKGCDTIQDWRTMRGMNDAVYLEGLRCDGGAHGGCQAACLVTWKTAWLTKLAGPDAPLPEPKPFESDGDCTLESLEKSTQAPPERGEPRYRCQATDHLLATTPLHWWELGPYVQDLSSGNVELLAFVGYLLIALYNMIQRRIGRGHPYLEVTGLAKSKTPNEQLNLRPGELVEVRPADEIMPTINAERKNRGLTFDVEMLPYCGKRFRVLRRVEKIINERNGAMMNMPNDCIVLEGVTCGGCLSQYRMFCPRAIYPYWREIWLRRVE